ncbi:Arabinose 5-phosphate isomerase KdsD [Alphaproteobacteria bacterium SO-S41]|nr:Arabinose 5-phosphate isomerase KdsD [Alphaproteobacteria bacterium SO-S41]
MRITERQVDGGSGEDYLKAMSAPAPHLPASDDLAVARRVLGIEAAALTSLAAAIDASFARAVDVLIGVTGRVIVSGMGKSHHVSTKIAATLSSTGTPAQFVHPAEASHGDLGMITPRDAVLVLSNSGETRELADLILHTRRQGIPLIGMASRPGSTLLRAADIALVLPPAEEACPMGLAPTTSTTMMLALGDALAVALMERRGFGREQYKVFHPGGSLGQALLTVRDLMHTGDEMPLVAESATMEEAVAAMSAKRFGCVGITDASGALAGILTDGDMRRRFGENLSGRPVGTVMTSGPKTIAPKALASEALAVLNRAQITALFVVDDPARPPLGLIHVHDCLKAGLS